MDISAASTPGTSAGSLLNDAFMMRDGFRSGRDEARIGIVGNGVPETLISAAGAIPVHLLMGDCREASDIESVIEPFVDDEVRTFLERLVGGGFSDCLGILFARDDAPALTAYQYATEWVRQGRAGAGVPPLFLWNLVHTESSPARRFNAVQAEKLFDFLAAIGLPRPGADDICRAAQVESRRLKALARMEATVHGTTSLRWRNAGRFMSAGEHAGLIEAAMDEASDEVPVEARLGLVGSPFASVRTYQLMERYGAIVCDLQPWGGAWPGAGNAEATLEGILAATAGDASCHRINPANSYRKWMVERLVRARCDLVICQLSHTDDTFGWEVPGLSAELGGHGIGFLNLGFRDREPDEAWLEQAAELIAARLEGPR